MEDQEAEDPQTLIYWPGYMVQRRPEKGPFFRFTKSRLLTQEHLVSGGIATDRDRCLEVHWSQLPYWGQRQQQHNVANQIHG